VKSAAAKEPELDGKSDAYRALFSDIHPPLSDRAALVESQRCLFCADAPCVAACPTSIDIPLFIREISTHNPKGAARTILQSNIMGAMCARVCPTEVLCEQDCVRNQPGDEPIQIGLLQRHAVDALYEAGEQPFTRGPASGRRVAVVGAGPAGLSCAHRLARYGHEVTVFEKNDKPGGLNEYGIAAYKVPDEIARREVEFILSIGGIEVKCGQVLGRDITLEGLRKEFDAVFLGVGMNAVNALGLGSTPPAGVEDAVEFIARLRQARDPAEVPTGRRVVVIGGGMTAVDAAIQSKKLGAEQVHLVYRRGAAEMNASGYEQELAQVNGVSIIHWARPAGFIETGGKLSGAVFERTRQGARGLEGTGETFELGADTVFCAIGQKLDAEILALGTEAVALEGGRFSVDEDCKTSLPDVWAGGDCAAGGEDLTVVAVEDGKLAALSIHQYLMGDGA
jgi:glutamate synthase (NADPH/NADH) small chain